MEIVNYEWMIRPNIKELKPYSCARTEFTGEASVFLDANESPYNDPYNRYPDPFQMELKKLISEEKNIPVENIFLGNGSDEAIDLIYRIFCEPKQHNVVAIDPTYGMYKVCADINNVEYRSVKLNENFEFEYGDLLEAASFLTKVFWICSPNNPTGNSMSKKEIVKLLDSFGGIVVVDEAYIDFSSQESMMSLLEKHNNLIILQTFSKAWASAGLRLGMAFASEKIIATMNKVKYPYNVNTLTQKHAISLLKDKQKVKDWVKIILEQRGRLADELKSIACVEKIYPSDANFLLVKVTDANAIYDYLVSKGIIVRNRNNVSLCLGCLRISIGTPDENTALIEALKAYKG